LKRVSPPHRRVERDPSRSPAWVGRLASCSASVGLVRRTSRVHALRHRREPGLTGWRREARRPWGTGRNTLRYGEGDKRGTNGPCVIFRLALTSSETILGADRAWWSDWSSKPAGVLLDLGRFDSYTLPPHLSYLCRTSATWLCGTCLSHSRRLHDVYCGPWHCPCVGTGRLAGSEPCPLLRSVMRNEDQDCGLAATPRGAATRRRLYPSTSRTFCASAAALNGFC